MALPDIGGLELCLGVFVVVVMDDDVLRHRCQIGEHHARRGILAHLRTGRLRQEAAQRHAENEGNEETKTMSMKFEQHAYPFGHCLGNAKLAGTA